MPSGSLSVCCEGVLKDVRLHCEWKTQHSSARTDFATHSPCFTRERCVRDLRHFVHLQSKQTMKSIITRSCRKWERQESAFTQIHVIKLLKSVNFILYKIVFDESYFITHVEVLFKKLKYPRNLSNFCHNQHNNCISLVWNKQNVEMPLLYDRKLMHR